MNETNQALSAQDQIFELQSNLEKTQWTLQDMATMGALIASIHDLEKILSVVMEMSIRMVEGEVGLIQLYENKELVTRVNWGVDDAVIKSIRYKDGEDIASYCFNKQETIVESDFDHKLKLGQKIKCFLALPIKSRARCHGMILIINKASGDSFTEIDKSNLEMLMNFAAVSIDNSILLKESLARQKYEQELEIARQIQETILPDRQATIDGIDIGTAYFPAREVGGDFYDMITINESDFLFVIGDVSDKGVPAAMVMSAASAIIKTQLDRDPSVNPAKLVARLNNILCRGIIKSHQMFITLFIARFNMEKHRLVYCNAGHLPPLFKKGKDDEIVELKLGGTFVGQFPELDFKQGEMAFESGDSVFAFTDGLTEAENVSGEFFGKERAKQVFSAIDDETPDEFCVKVKEWINRFAEGASEDTVDDFTLVNLRII
jgi:sigma-B regulation protein RsbU (phosphoserine phosphatase)